MGTQQSGYEMKTEVNDPVFRVVGYVFGAIGGLLLLGLSLLPCMTAFPDPNASAKAAMALLPGVMVILVCIAVLRSILSGHKNEWSTFFLRTHQTIGAILVYMLIGSFGIMFLSIVNLVLGWSVIGALIAAALVFTYRFYKCPHCRKLFAAQLILVERTGTATSPMLVNTIYGGVAVVKEEYGVFRRTYRCRYCLKTWAR
ncbi:MAG: hypothetical protein MUD12_12640 [Spirochaetes bacterium]|jgi:hypothetical protein|nr:hypothetical protein [Spirochaetota bacterium]